MSATFNLFERWKAHKGINSYRQAALALGVSAQTVQFWKDGKNGEPEYIVKMANDLGESPVRTVLEAYAEQKKGDSAKVLFKLSKQFGAVMLAVVMATLFVAPESVHAKTSHIPLGNVYYVSVNRLRRTLSRLGYYLKWICRKPMRHHA